MVTAEFWHRNYDELVDPVPVCIQNIEALLTNEEPKYQRVLLLKAQTKVASKVLEKEPDSLDSLLEKIFEWNMKGAEKTQTEKNNRLTKRNLSIMRAHFYTHAAKIAEKIFKKTEKLTWLENAYNCRKLSGDLSLTNEPKHASHQYGFAGDFAEQLFERTQKQAWLEKAYFNSLKSADLRLANESSNVAGAYLCTAHRAKKLFDYTGDVEWGEKAYDACIKAARLGCKHNKEMGYKAQSLGVDILRRIVDKTGDNSRLEDEYSKYLNYHGDAEQIIQAKRYAGLLASRLYDRTRKKKQKKWSKKAVECLNEFVSYYRSNKDPAVCDAVRQAQSTIRYLESQTKDKHEFARTPRRKRLKP